MKTAQLSDVARLDYGFAFDSKQFNSEGRGLPLVRIRDVLPGRSSTYYSGEYTDRYLVSDGDYLIGMDGQFNLARWQGGKALLNQRVCRIGELDVSLDRAYLARFLPHALKAIEDATPFVTVKHLSAKALNAIDVPLPPLAEQRRIAAILDLADALRAKRRQVLTHLDDLIPSIFREMFGDPARNPLGFPLATIRSLAEKFSDGPFGSNLKSSHYVDAGVPVVRLQNIGVGRYLDQDRAFVSEVHYTTLSKHDCRPGDILIGTLGNPNLRACIQPDFLPRALNKADCIQFRTDPRVADPVWACWLLNQPGTLSLAASLAHGQTRTRIAMGQLRDLRVPVPPLDLQREFAVRVAAVLACRARTVDASATDDRLFASLQARAFQGEL